MQVFFGVLSVLCVLKSGFTLLEQNNHNETSTNYTNNFFDNNTNIARNISIHDFTPTNSDNITAFETTSLSEESKIQNVIEFNKNEQKKPFRPSPELREDRFSSVKPVLGEPKLISSFNSIKAEEDDDLKEENNKKNANYFIPSSNKKRQFESNDDGHVNAEEINNLNPQSWTVQKVKFPSESSNMNNNNANTPYPYYFVQNNCCNNEKIPKKENFALPQKDFSPYPNYYYGNNNMKYSSSPYSSVNEYHRGFNFNKFVEPTKNVQKTFTYDEPVYNIMEKPSSYNNLHHYEQNNSKENPWKKILKLLATFIPVGLLISALTPTIITVTTNETMPSTSTLSRYRSIDDPKKELHKEILNSLKYFDELNEKGCEFRIFCELLMIAQEMPKNSEERVQEILNNYEKMDGKFKDKAKELEAVFRAVNNKNCASIPCSSTSST